MTTLSSGAVGFAPVGAFVNDLAKELGKSASTLTAYLRKHLPATLSKRKNSNNRLANWVTSEGEAGLRAHYKPTSVPQAPSELELEVQRLRARVAELEAENAGLREQVKRADAAIAASGNAVKELRDLRYAQEAEADKQAVASLKRDLQELSALNNQFEENLRRETNVRPKLFTKESRREQTKAIRQLLDEQDEEYERECQSRVVRFPTEKVRKTEE